MLIKYTPQQLSAYGVFRKREWQDVVGGDILRDLIASRLEALGYEVGIVYTSGFDAISTLTRGNAVYRVYERPENLPPDARQVLEELDAATITFAADGTVRIE